MNNSDGIYGVTRECEFHGKRRERRFWIVFTRYWSYTKRDAPDWFIGIRKAKEHEDILGADYFFLTDVGEIPVDVKSSPEGAFISQVKYGDLKNRKNIAIVAVGHPFLDHAQNVRLRTFKAVAAKREALLRN